MGRTPYGKTPERSDSHKLCGGRLDTHRSAIANKKSMRHGLGLFSLWIRSSGPADLGVFRRLLSLKFQVLLSSKTFSLVPFEHGKHMAVAFKRLPAVTFRGMLIRPQSSAGPRRGTSEKPGTLVCPPRLAAFYFFFFSPLPAYRRQPWLCLIW